MSKRIDKKKQKRQADITTSANTIATSAETTPSPAVSASNAPVMAKVPAPSEQIDFYIQYQNQEYLEKDIIEKIKEKCKNEGTEITGAEKLSVYLKPEDGKAYFTCAGFSSFVEV